MGKAMPMRGKKRLGAAALGTVFLVVGGFDARGEQGAIDTEGVTDATGIPVDPVVEEPIRSLATDAIDGPSGPNIAECGVMNGFVIPIGVLFTTGLGCIPRRRGRRPTPR